MSDAGWKFRPKYTAQHINENSKQWAQTELRLYTYTSSLDNVIKTFLGHKCVSEHHITPLIREYHRLHFILIVQHWMNIKRNQGKTTINIEISWWNAQFYLTGWGLTTAPPALPTRLGDSADILVISNFFPEKFCPWIMINNANKHCYFSRLATLKTKMAVCVQKWRHLLWNSAKPSHVLCVYVWRHHRHAAKSVTVFMKHALQWQLTLSYLLKLQ